jgi:hypothetical protein
MTPHQNSNRGESARAAAAAAAAAQRVKHRRAGSWQPMIAVRSGKLLKVVTSNFRELVASIQGKMGKNAPMHLRSAIDTPSAQSLSFPLPSSHPSHPP